MPERCGHRVKIPGIIQSAEYVVKFEAMIFWLVWQKKCKQTELLSERKSYEEKKYCS